MNEDYSTLYSILRFFVGSATTLLLAFVVLVGKLPQGPGYRKTRIAKYMLFAAYFTLGAPLLLFKVYRITALSMFVSYLSDNISYGLLLSAPVVMLSEKYRFASRDIIVAVISLCVVLQCYFVLGYPIFGICLSALKWALFVLSLGIIIYIGVSGVRKSLKCDRNDGFVKWFVIYYFCVLMVIVLYQLVFPVVPALDKAILSINVMFVLASGMFILKFYEYIALLRVSAVSQVPETKEALPAEDEDQVPLSADEEAAFKQRLDNWVEMKRFLEQDEGIETIVNELGTDINTFRAYFRTRMSSDFRTWRITLRIEYAKEMLRDNPGISMNRLSDLCGFTTRSNFYYYFKKYTGMTPAEYKDTLSRVV